MSLPYLPLFVDDYEADTAHLSLIEDGIYSRLLRLCWRSPQCRLPNDKEWIARKIRASSAKEREAMDAVLAEFFTKQRRYIFSKRLSAEYDRVCASVKRLSNAGKSGARAKALKRNKTGASDAKATLKHPDPEPYPKEKPIGFSQRAGAQKKSGFVKPRTAADAAMAFIERRRLNDEPEGTGADGEGTSPHVPLLSAVGNR